MNVLKFCFINFSFIILKSCSKSTKNRHNSIAISTFNQINVLSQLCYFHSLSEIVNIQIPSINEKTNAFVRLFIFSVL